MAARAVMMYPTCMEVRSPLLDITQEALMKRILYHLPRRDDEYGSAYVGSTSDPAWRWNGGLTWRCERDALVPRLLPTHMVGHKISWGRMFVVGAFSDRQTAAFETAVLERLRHRECMTNVASDARGLAIRPVPAYSFIYVCREKHFKISSPPSSVHHPSHL